jgi:hypothetical protein
MIDLKKWTNDEIYSLISKLEEELDTRLEKKLSTITIGKDGLCECSCAHKCPLGKTGSENRCKKEELVGYI